MVFRFKMDSLKYHFLVNDKALKNGLTRIFHCICNTVLILLIVAYVFT